jgi:hypothetical protein
MVASHYGHLHPTISSFMLPRRITKIEDVSFSFDYGTCFVESRTKTYGHLVRENGNGFCFQRLFYSAGWNLKNHDI